VSKLNKKTVYTVFGMIAAGVLIYVYTEPEAVGKKAVRKTATSRTAKKEEGSLITEEDLKARFPRYSQPLRDVFQPGVTTGKAAVALKAKPAPARRVAPLILPPPRPVKPEVDLAAWTLTGVSLVNGVKTALIENKATSESVFVKPGSLWKGLRIASVESDALVLIEPTGKTRRLAFPAPPEEKVARVRPDATEQVDPGQPALPQPPRVPRGATVAGEPGPAASNGVQP
jgi:hypothetical protein